MKSFNILKKSYSIRSRMLAILIAILVPVSLCLLIISGYTSRKLRTEIVLTNLSVLKNQTSNLDKRLKQEQNFLSNLFATDPGMYFLRQASKKRDWSNYIYQIKQDFIKSQTEGNIGEIYFLLPEDPAYSTYTTQSGLAGDVRLSSVSWLSQWQWKAEPSSIVRKFVRIGEEWYYLIAFHDQKVCIGGLTSAKTITGLLEMRSEDGAVVSVVNDEHMFMTESAWAEAQEIIYEPVSKQPYYITGKNNGYVAIQCSSQQLPGEIVYMVRDAAILGNMKPIALFLRAVAIVMLLLIPLSLTAMRYVLFVPLDRLKTTIQQIKDGGMDTEVDVEHVSREMGEVYALFNEMMAQIRHFKIRYYEEEIRKKDYQLQYFSLQVKPHFYMNSLKCLYALAQNQEYKKVQTMILNLSDYFKQITYDNCAMVPLASELEHVSLYMDIRQMGVENEIQCNLSMDNRARKIPVPVLCVQTFVENSIKYGRVNGQELKIDIKISMIEQGEKSYLDLMVTDNGPGYRQEIIRAINKASVDNIEGHIGLTNLWNRLRLIYEDTAFMAISNLPKGGAYSEILLPIRRDEE